MHNTHRSARITRPATALCLAAGTALAQSDPGNFETVINLPDDMPRLSGRVYGSTQINVYDGGEVLSRTIFGWYEGASNNIELNIYGGEVRNSIELYEGTTVNLLGGRLADGLIAIGDVTVNVYAGTFSDSFTPDASFQNGSVLNIFNAGSVHSKFRLGEGSVANMYAGRLSSSVNLSSGGTFNLFGGELYNGARVEDGLFVMTGGFLRGNLYTDDTAQVRILGGRLSSGNVALYGGTTELLGGEFELNAQPVTSLPEIQDNDVLTVTLPDGSVVVLRSDEQSSYYTFSESTLTLQPAQIPALDLTPIVLETGPSPVEGLRRGQTLTLRGDASLPGDFNAIGAELRLEGGTVGDGLTLVDSSLTVTGDAVTGDIEAFRGSRVLIDAGTIEILFALHDARAEILTTSGRSLVARDTAEILVHHASLYRSVVVEDDGVIEFRAGDIGVDVVVEDRARLTLTDSHVADDVLLSGPSTTTLTNVTVADLTFAESGATLDATDSELRGGLWVTGDETTVTLRRTGFANSLLLEGGTTVLHAGEFLLNGSPVESFPDWPGFADVISGVFENGRVFIVAPITNDITPGGTVQTVPVSVPPADLTPRVITSAEETSLGLRPGQSLTLDAEEASLPNGFALTGAELVVRRGSIGDSLEAVHSDVTILGGQVGSDAVLHRGVNLTVDGGTLGDGAALYNGAALTIHSGSVGADAVLRAGSSLAMHDGALAGGFQCYDDGSVLVTGGTVGAPFGIFDDTIATVRGGTFEGSVTTWRRSTLTVTGGDLGPAFRVAYDGHAIIAGGSFGPGLRHDVTGTLELQGVAFEIDGVPIDSLAPNTPHPVTQRGVTLSGRLADGSTFDLPLDANALSDEYYVHPDADLLVTLVAPLCPADVQTDGVLDQGDIASFVERFLAQDPRADLNADGVIDIADIGLFVNAFLAGC